MSLSRILVVDDEVRMLRSVERVLSQDYKVVTTPFPREAAGIAEAFKPALAILDIQMPEIDGFELMEKLHAIDPEMDVILMTGSVHEIDAKLIRAIRKNAFYFLQKPFDREVLLTLVERCLELRRLNGESRRHSQRMEKELAEARAFQQSMLPSQQGKAGSVSIFARYIPCSELAGDFYDYAAAGTDAAAILVADVSGHGASAAMLTGVVKSAFRSASAEDFEPASVVRRVSSGIRAFSHHHFITMICVRLRKGFLEFINAGHPPAILCRVGGATALLENTGPIVSPAFPGFSWDQQTITVQDAHRIVLFTDGLIEAASESGEYGLERLVRQIAKNSERGDVLVEQVLKDVREFSGGRPTHDDLTLVVADL